MKIFIRIKEDWAVCYVQNAARKSQRIKINAWNVDGQEKPRLINEQIDHSGS
jgi:hypothetical protein